MEQQLLLGWSNNLTKRIKTEMRKYYYYEVQ